MHVAAARATGAQGSVARPHVKLGFRRSDVSVLSFFVLLCHLLEAPCLKFGKNPQATVTCPIASANLNAVNGEFPSPDTGAALRTVETVIEYGQSTSYHYDAPVTFRFATFALI
jgi:hypothetical protein